MGDWLAAIGVLGLYVLALSWFAAAIGILARSPEAAQGITFLVSFLPYPSSAFVPIHTMPSALQRFASNQPATAVADTLRALLSGHSAGASEWHAIAWCVGLIAVSVVLAGGTIQAPGGLGQLPAWEGHPGWQALARAQSRRPGRVCRYEAAA